MNDIHFKNSGFIPEQRPTDYRFGGATAIAHENRNSTGDWQQFLPMTERQSGRFFDTMACVTFSAMNSLETQLRWMLANKLLPVATMQFLSENGYLDDAGMPNLSDRFTAKMSGTTTGGNSIQAVWDSIRKHGVAPEKAWPNNLETFNREQYYAEPTAEVKALALTFLKHFKAEYEFVYGAEDRKKALRHAPLHVATATCPGWATDTPVAACASSPNHATLIFDLNEQTGVAYDFDHYEPFVKELAAGYEIHYCAKGVLTPLLKDDGSPDPAKQPFEFTRDLVRGETSIDVAHLQRRLVVIDPPTGWYGPMTQAGVQRYMKFNTIGSWWEQNVWPAGRRVGPKIRAYLNTHAT